MAGFGKIPLSFEPNQGQTDPKVQFVAHGPGYSLYLAPGEAYVSLEPQPEQQTADGREALRMRLKDARIKADVAGLEKQGGVVNYFVGNDPKKWHAGIATFGQVKYTGIYPGIDLVFYGNQSQLEYDFVIAPGADAAQIAWEIDGARLAVDGEGNLQLNAANGPASFKKPVIYQTDGDKKLPVQGRYVVAGNKVSFALGAYDHSKSLVIDPVLTYLTYLGAPVSTTSPVNGVTHIGGVAGFGVNGSELSQAMAIDREGDVYVTGYTNALDFPVKDAYQDSDSALKINSGVIAAFVTKLNPEGTELVYSTYLSGGQVQSTYGQAIAVDAEGSAYVAGYTGDPDFPTTPGAFQTICGDGEINGARTANCQGGAVNGFVTKLDPAGSRIVYSTFLGAFADYINGIAVDSSGRAYVAGISEDACSPTVPSFDCFPTTADAVQTGEGTCVTAPGDTTCTAYGAMGWAFLTVFNPEGTGLAYSTLLGDNLADIVNGSLAADMYGPTTGISVAVNSAGEFFLTGRTSASKLPVTEGVFEPKTIASLPNAGTTGYVAKFNPIGSGGNLLRYLTYLGMTPNDPNFDSAYPGGITADAEGNAYITGWTNSQYFPTTKGSFQPTCGEVNFDECGTAFVSKLNASGSKLLWSTLFGEPAGDASGINSIGPIQLDAEGNVYVAGQAQGDNYFPQINPVEHYFNGNAQAFVAEFNPSGSKVNFWTLLGSLTYAGGQSAAGLAIDRDRNIYVAGNTSAGGLETTKGAFQRNYRGGTTGASWGFLAKIAPVAPTTTGLKFATSKSSTGEIVKLTATVTTAAYSPSVAGEVVFKAGTKVLGSAKLNGDGVAVYEAKELKPGQYSFTASYAGNEYFYSSVSGAVKGDVPAATATSLKASVNPSTYKKPVTFTAKVTSADGVPTGTVTFKKNGTVLTSVVLKDGVASYTTSALVVGTHQIEAGYAGSAEDAASTSDVVAEVTKAAQ